jgi:TPR repeat protein
MAAAEGLMNSAKCLSSLYEIGEHVKADYDTHRIWLKRAADLGDAESVRRFAKEPATRRKLLELHRESEGGM